MCVYKHIKCSLHYEQYLEYVVSKPLRSAITKIENFRSELKLEGIERTAYTDAIEYANYVKLVYSVTVTELYLVDLANNLKTFRRHRIY
jgi:hypothetical protein